MPFIQQSAAFPDHLLKKVGIAIYKNSFLWKLCQIFNIISELFINAVLQHWPDLLDIFIVEIYSI